MLDVPKNDRRGAVGNRAELTVIRQPSRIIEPSRFERERSGIPAKDPICAHDDAFNAALREVETSTLPCIGAGAADAEVNVRDKI